MSTTDEILLIAIISQLKGSPIDFKILAHDLGTPTAGAAQKRWSRFRKRLMNKQTNNSSKPIGVHKTVPSLVKNGKKYMDVNASGGRSIEEEEILATPVRKMPGRKARVLKFTEYSTEEEEEEEEDKREDFIKAEDINSGPARGEVGEDADEFWI